MGKRLVGVLLGLTMLTSGCADQSPVFVELDIGAHRIEAEVAADRRTKRRGLMYRQSMAEERGMLFVFSENRIHCMWMRNTLLPLSVAFLDVGGRILNVEDMNAETDDQHCASGPAQYALEMNRGWFERHGVGPGAVVGPWR